MFLKIEKRNKEIVDFNKEKIKNAIIKAFESIKKEPKNLDFLLEQVIKELEKIKVDIPNVEQVSDAIENVLMINEQAVAKSFIIFREYKRQLREISKAYIGTTEKNNFGLNSLKILEGRYLLKDDNGNITETPNQLFERVSKAIVKADEKYLSKKKLELLQNDFYNMMYNLDFLPNTPTLMNAGTPVGQLSACFVLPVEDSMLGIFESVKNTALIHQSGGGTGFSFSRLRQKGAIVSSTKGTASGPISFMKVFNTATDVVKQGGKRRGANMGILRVDHPDILEFISCKQQEGNMANFNISVGITDKFMQAVEDNTYYDLIDPRNNNVVTKMNARSVFDLIANLAWQNGEPGVIFIDQINKYNQVKNVGEIEATNPCGEQPLLPYESCNLGSINLANMIENNSINWNKLESVIKLAVRFLDNVIDVNKYPLPQIDSMTKSTRKIGLGVMGFADMLYQLKIPYNSDEGIYLGEKIMKFITDIGVEESVKLGELKGNFPAFKDSYWSNEGYKYMRNATITTIAPTGTIGLIADVSGGVEPVFSLAFTRFTHVDDQELIYSNKFLEKELKSKGIYSEELMLKICKTGSVAEIPEIPEDIKRIFVTSREISPEWHIKMQAAFQKYTHNGVSKTINMPNFATIDDVKQSYLLAYKLGCKGLTVYRDGSREFQILNAGTKKVDFKEEKKPLQKLITKEIPKDECPICHSKMTAQEGCYTCKKCSYSKCS